MPKGKQTVVSVCDQHCKGCVYYYEYGSGTKVCEYMFQTGFRRPCPAGKGCTVRATKKGRTMAQRMEADAYSYLARKEAQDKLSIEMRQCDQDGSGVSYGKWKAAQPVQEVEKPEIPEGWKKCPHCGTVFRPKAKTSKYCCDDCRNAAYQILHRDRKAEAVRKWREKQKAEAEKERSTIE